MQFRMKCVPPPCIGVGLALAGGLWAAAPGLAAPQQVTVNTSALTTGATYYAEFTLTDGSTSVPGTSLAAISNFLVTGGALGAVLPPTTGDVTGSLGSGSTLTLKDDSATASPLGLADFAQAFTLSAPVSALSFGLNLTAAGVNSPRPDDFTFQILDSTQTPLNTVGSPTGTEFVGATYTTTQPTPTGYSSLTPPVTATVTPALTAVPEPGTLPLLGLGLLGLAGLRARRRPAPAA